MVFHLRILKCSSTLESSENFLSHEDQPNGLASECILTCSLRLVFSSMCILKFSCTRASSVKVKAKNFLAAKWFFIYVYFEMFIHT